MIDLERVTTTDPRFEGIVLRYGRLYGPGTWETDPDEPPTVHVEAAARAALLAVDRGEPGIYNIANDGGPVSNARARQQLGWSPCGEDLRHAELERFLARHPHPHAARCLIANVTRKVSRWKSPV